MKGGVGLRRKAGGGQAVSGGELIPVDTRVDDRGPAVDAALEVGHLRVALGAQELRDAHGAASVVARNEDGLVPGQFGELRRHKLHGDVYRAGEAADGQLVVLADIEE